MANLSIMTQNGSIKTIELDGLSNYVPQTGEVIMFDGRVEDYSFEISGSDIILTLPNGEELILSNMADMLAEQDEENPTKLTIASGDEGDVLVLDNYGTLTEIMEAAAAGEEASNGESQNNQNIQTVSLDNTQDETVQTIEESDIQRERRVFEIEDEAQTLNNPTVATSEIATPSIEIDIIAPDTPIIELTSDITNDNTPTISGTAEALSTITLSVNGVAYTTETTEDGSWSVTTDQIEDGIYEISATATDEAGNISDPTTVSITVDTSAQEGTVSIDTIAGDDIINASESNADTITVTGSATGGDITSGDTVTVTVNGTDYTTTVQADGTYSVDVSTTDLVADNSVEVNVVSTDNAGNSVTSGASKDITVDTSAQEGTVSIDTIAGDDIINASESNADTITVTGSATGGDITSGDTVTVTVNGTDYTTTVQADGTYSVDVSTTDLVADNSVEVNVVSTDNAGNSVTSGASRDITVDTSAQEGTVSIDTIAGDDIINASESNADTITVTGSATGGDITSGDTVTVTVNGNEYTTTVQADGTYSVDVSTTDLIADNSVEVNVVSTDNAGNSVTSGASRDITVDTSAQEGTVSIDTIAGDDIINASESNADTITVTGSATGGDITSGDTVTVTVNGNEYTTTVQADGTYSVDVSTTDLIADNSVEVNVVSTDNAGNSVTSGASRDITVDTSAQEGTVSIDTIAGDDIINASESNADTITVTGSATGGDITSGDTVTVTVNGNEYTTTVQADGTYSVDVSTTDLIADNSVEVNVVSTDNAGNSVTSGASRDITVDTSAQEGTVSIDTIAGDDIINASESNADTITVTGSATGGDITSGDTVTVTVNGNEYTTTVQADGTYSVDVSTTDLIADNSVEVNVVSTDNAGNSVTSEASRDVTVDTQVDIPTITNIVDTNGNMSEILVSGSGNEEGNTITLFDQNGNIVATTQVQEDGTWSVDIAALADNSEFKLYATQTDSVGNESNASDDVTVYQSTAGGTNTYSSDDFVFAGSGNDHVRVNADDADGQLVVDGGAGTDTIRFDNNTSAVNVDLSKGSASSNDDNIELRNFENAYGGKADDTLTGDSGANLLYGADGDDTIDGGEGNDALYGGNGADTIQGGLGNDTLGGGNGNDILYGGAGDDKIHGQNGDDTIIGGAGDDTIRTDGGTDTVVFSGTLSDYIFTYNSSNQHIIVEDTRDGSPDGTDDVYGAEFFQFSDQTVSTAIPSTPSIDLVASSDTGDSDTDNETSDTTPTFSISLGTGISAGYVITLNAGDQEVEYTISQTDIDNGYAEVTTDELSIGEYDVSATITNLIGLESNSSSTINLEIINDIPDAPVISEVVDENTITGTIGDNVSDVVIQIKDSDGNIVAQYDATIDGNDWSADFVKPSTGDYTIVAVALNENGDESEVSDHINLNVGTTYENISEDDDITNIVYDGRGSNTITTGSGDDVFSVNAGNDTFNAGSGDDTFLVDGSGDGYNKFRGGEGTDTVQGSAGDDSINLNEFGTDNSIEVIDGGEGTNVIQGGTYTNMDFSETELKNIDSIKDGRGSNTITGNDQDTVYDVNAGNDTFNAGSGDDTFLVDGSGDGYNKFRGGEGTDTVQGSAGDDSINLNEFGTDNSIEVIDGGEGTNVIQGGTYTNMDFSETELKNIDSIKDGRGSNTITGNDQDTVYDVNAGNDTFNAGSGDDTFLVDGSGDGYNKFRGGEGTDTVQGSAGDDSINLNEFGTDNSIEVIDGGEGTNVIQGGTYTNMDFSETELKNIDSIKDGRGSNTITGNDQDTVYDVNAGNDTFNAGSGDDTFLVDGSGDGYNKFRGGEGTDTVQGSAGDDSINLNEFGTDNSIEVIDGGEGTNVIQGGTYTNMDFSETELKNIDNIQGGNGNNTIIGSDGDDTIDGGKGRDTIDAGSGDDTIITDSTSDKIDGGEGYDTLIIEKDISFDFDSLSESQITNIEEIKLGEGNQNLENLSADDVLGMTGVDSTDEAIMKIIGDSDDTVSLDSNEWTNNGKVTDDDGNEFDVYQGNNDSVKLYIESDIVVTDV